jgi:hypothetical protein
VIGVCIYNTDVKTVLELGMEQGNPMGDVPETFLEAIYKVAQPRECQ